MPQVATLAAQQVLQPMHVAAALTHLAKLHAMGLPPREVERFRASGLVQRLAGKPCTLRRSALGPNTKTRAVSTPKRPGEQSCTAPGG